MAARATYVTSSPSSTASEHDSWTCAETRSSTGCAAFASAAAPRYDCPNTITAGVSSYIPSENFE